MNEVLTYEALKADRDALERQLLISEAKCKGYFSDAATALIKCDALAVENAALKSAVTAKAYIDFIESNGWNAGVKTINGKFAAFMDPEVDFGSMTFEHAKKLIDAVETPATDAAIASIESRGVERFADFLGKQYQCEKANTAKGKAYKHVVFLACRFARELQEAK